MSDSDTFLEGIGASNGAPFDEIIQILGNDTRQEITSGPSNLVGGHIEVQEAVIVYEGAFDINDTSNILGLGWRIQIYDSNGAPIDGTTQQIVGLTDNQFIFNFQPTAAQNGNLSLIRVNGVAGSGIPGLAEAHWAAAGIDPAYNTTNGAILTGENLVPAYEDVAICFASGTMIKTDQGEVAIEDLAADDMVLTLNNGYKPIFWIGKRELSAADLQRKPKLRPIRIRAGALGPNQPEQDLVVSPQHRMLVSSKIVKRMFGEDQVLVPAVKLLEVDGVDVVEDADGVAYWHVLFDEHEVIYANGALGESLYTGPQAINSLSPEARQEIYDLMPEVFDIDYRAASDWKLVSGKKAHHLTNRHVKNGKHLVNTAVLH